MGCINYPYIDAHKGIIGKKKAPLKTQRDIYDKVVREKRFELLHRQALDSKSSASTNSAILAHHVRLAALPQQMAYLAQALWAVNVKKRFSFSLAENRKRIYPP